MSYPYYQNTTGWGTNQFQFGQPPAPTFAPQPSWGGLDYFRAHAGNADPQMYHSALSRLRDYAHSASGYFASRHAAHHWHRRVYSGLTPLAQVRPADLGAAAAYEVYRSFKYNSTTYAPLANDRERQREALIGMAVAEAWRLWQQAGRGYDNAGTGEASEAAALTASYLFRRIASNYGGAYDSPRSYNSVPYDDDFDDDYEDTRRPRRRAHSAVGTRPIMIQSGGPVTPYSGGLPMPGVGYGGAGAAYGGAAPGYASAPQVYPGAGQIGAQQGYPGAGQIGAPQGYPGGGLAMPGGGMGGGYAGSAYAGAGLPGSYPGASAGMAGMSGSHPGYGGASPYLSAGNIYGGAGAGPYGAAGGSAYGGAPPVIPGYASSGGYGGAGGMGQPAGPTVIIERPRRSSRHSMGEGHHHHHHRRAASADPVRYADERVQYADDRYRY